MVEFQDTRKIGDREVVCVREEGEFEAIEDGKKVKGKLTRWLSNQVPGNEVHMVGEGELDGRKVKRIQTVDDFFVPKAK